MTNENQTEISQLEAIIEEVTGHKPSEFDTFLAHNISPPEIAQGSISLYRAIEEICEGLGHRLFIPFPLLKTEEYDELSFRDALVMCEKIMIPKTKFFICDLNLRATEVRLMTQIARELKKPQIYFQSKEIAKISSPYMLEDINKIKAGYGFKAMIDYSESELTDFLRMIRQVIKYNFK